VNTAANNPQVTVTTMTGRQGSESGHSGHSDRAVVGGDGVLPADPAELARLIAERDGREPGYAESPPSPKPPPSPDALRARRRREREKKKKANWRRRSDDGLAMANVEYDDVVVEYLIKHEWLNDANRSNREKVGDAISRCLAVSARS
jgi:hypothetical protein